MRPYDDDFEDLSPFLEAEGVVVDLPKELHQALSDAEVFADDDKVTAVTVELSKNLITVTGEGEMGWLEEKVRFKYGGEDTKFQINPIFLRHILGVLPEVTIGDKAICFKSERCTHVLALEA